MGSFGAPTFCVYAEAPSSTCPLFTLVRKIRILRSSRVTHSRNFPLIAFSDVPGHKGTERGPRHATPALFWLPVTEEVAALSDAHTFAEWHHADGKG